MKQHITKSDLNQLTESGKEKLKTWWWSKLDKTSQWVEIDANKQINSDIFPSTQWLNIGRLIEFLMENKKSFVGIDSLCETGGEHLHIYGGRIEIFYNKAMDIELCDALWSACVEILNK